jgi:hypothetical protein
MLPAGSIWALAVHDGELIVGGDFTGAGGIATDHIARWDGVDWHPMGDGLNARVRDFVSYDGAFYAAGLFTQSGATTVRRVARWDGAAWSEFGDGMPGPVRAFTVLGSDLIVAGAFVKQLPEGAQARHIARWNGVTWDQLGSGLGAPAIGVLANGNELWVGGLFTTAGFRSSNHVAGGTSRFQRSARTTAAVVMAGRTLHVDVFRTPHSVLVVRFKRRAVARRSACTTSRSPHGARARRDLPVGPYVRPWDRDRAVVCSRRACTSTA